MKMSLMRKIALSPFQLFLFLLILFITGAVHPVFADNLSKNYEVWLSDQTNSQGLSATTPTGTYGGFVRIYDSSDLEKEPIVNAPLNIDMGVMFANALATTGANVTRIHGILPSPDHKTMALNFVASGHLAFVDGDSKNPICLFRTTGTPSGRQNHMSFWAPDGKKVIVANQNGKMIERVNVIRNANGKVVKYEFDADASLDLVGARSILNQPIAVTMNSDGIECTVKGTVASNQSDKTPSGIFKQAAGIRPNNALVCPIIASNNIHSFSTLAGGGMFVIDITTTPMQIVAEYDISSAGVRDAGCGGEQAKGYMHLNSGTSAAAPDQSEFSIYRFEIEKYPVAPAFNQPNIPAPITKFEDPDNGKNCHDVNANCAAHENRDSHGMVMVENVVSGKEKYLHQFDRIRNNVEVFKMASPWSAFKHLATYSLTDSGVCGTTLGAVSTNDPTPDLGGLSTGKAPNGSRIYIGTRGPFPLTVAHAAAGSCPGLGIVDLSPNRTSGGLKAVLDTQFLDFTGTKNLSDPHAAIVRQVQ